jgi:hypothetical protein
MDNQIKEILNRLTKLERVVFGEEKKIINKGKEEFVGPTGGIRLLISKGFFKTKRGLGEVKIKLAEESYHYSLQAVQNALNRLSGAGGPLVAFKENSKKVYAERK